MVLIVTGEGAIPPHLRQRGGGARAHVLGPVARQMVSMRIIALIRGRAERNLQDRWRAVRPGVFASPISSLANRNVALNVLI